MFPLNCLLIMVLMSLWIPVVSGVCRDDLTELDSWVELPYLYWRDRITKCVEASSASFE